MHRPPLVDSRMDDKLRDTVVPSPLRYGFRNPVDFYSVVCTTVVCLLQRVRPPAILWGVALRAVDAVKSFTLWARSHVVDKGLERISPTVADTNADSAVVLVRNMGFAVAACQHGFPAFALPVHVYTAVGVPSGFSRCAFLLNGKASAGRNLPAPHLAGLCRFFAAARTRKKPHRLPGRRFPGAEFGGQPPEDLPGDIQMSRHFCTAFRFVHIIY